jgi:hypothetical protein
MKSPMNACGLVLLFIVMSYGFASCSSSRNTDGFNYRSGSNAPDIGKGNEGIQPGKFQVLAITKKSLKDASIKEIDNINSFAEKISRELTPAARNKMQKMAEAIKKESRTHQENGTPITNRELIKQVTNNLVSSGTINPMTKSDMKKLDRLAKKLDRKIQKEGKDIDVKNNTNLELFFLIMGLAGLVLGILGVWVGWLLFVVFGGLYLYYKLVK